MTELTGIPWLDIPLVVGFIPAAIWIFAKPSAKLKGSKSVIAEALSNLYFLLVLYWIIVYQDWWNSWQRFIIFALMSMTVIEIAKAVYSVSQNKGKP